MKPGIMMIGAALAVLLLPAAPAQAMKCLQPTIEEEAKQAEAVFIGEKSAHLRQRKEGDMGDYAIYRLKVKKAWKGVKAGDELTVKTGIFYGNALYQHSTYLVFATRYDGEWWVGGCARLLPVLYPKTEIETLDGLYPQGN